MQNIVCIATFFDELKLMYTSTTQRDTLKYFWQQDAGKTQFYKKESSQI